MILLKFKVGKHVGVSVGSSVGWARKRQHGVFRELK